MLLKRTPHKCALAASILDFSQGLVDADQHLWRLKQVCNACAMLLKRTPHKCALAAPVLDFS
eukprot:6206100-Pleurochrysis_carterae.AAC.3